MKMAARRLTRSTSDKYIAGVCGGLAAYFEVDPVLVRIAAVAGLILSGGTFLIAYLAAWVIVPSDFTLLFNSTPPQSGAEPIVAAQPDTAKPTGPLRQKQFWTSYFPGLVLVGIGLIFLIRKVWWLSWEYLWPAVLIVIGLMVIVFSLNSGEQRSDSESHTAGRVE